MCGFVCIKSEKPEIHKFLELMQEKIKTRGPDSQKKILKNNFSGGFSRLSILDLTEESDQPFKVDNFPYILFFNGEIYNYKSLRKKLSKKYNFKTTSDTEVVYYAYCEWGNGCFKRFEGMFSVLIYNELNEDIILVRDQLGIKPLYYTIRDNSLFVASELKCFHGVFKLEPNVDRMIEYLSYGEIYGFETVFLGINKLCPGEIVFINNYNARKTKYFDLIDTFHQDKQEVTIDEINNLIVESVISHSNSDVPYGTQLSGGLDSCLVTAILYDNIENKLDTFSIEVDHSAVNESYFQNLFIEKFDVIHNPIVFDSDSFDDLNVLRKSIYNYDQPLHHANIIASDKLNRLASKKGIKVLLSGDGADEVFGGYQWNLLNFKNNNIENILDAGAMFEPALLEKYLNFHFSYKNLSELISNTKSIKNPFDKRSYIDQEFYVQRWLHRQDRCGMFSSVEIRVPYFTKKIIETINLISPKEKLNNYQQQKFLLKKVGLKYLDEEIVLQKKVGFTIPVDDWTKNSNFNNLLLEDRTLSRGIYKTDNIISLIKSRDNKRGKIIFALVNLELWFRNFID